MQRLLYVLFQLDEARRHIEDGRLERLRLALLLLDNAAEVQMDRRIREESFHEKIKERMQKQLLGIPGPVPPLLEELESWQPLSRSRKDKIDRFFDEKIKYLVERIRNIDRRLAEPLSYLHRYRNEAYHKAHVRPATIRTAAILLLEINCQLLLSLPRGSTSYGSNEDYSWITERFGKELWPGGMTTELLQELIDQIRVGMLPSEQSVAAALTQHLDSRFQTLYDSLDFIVQSSTLAADREAALLESQRYSDAQNTAAHEACKPAPRYKLSRVEKLAAEVSEIGKAADRLEAFHRFSLLERELEPIEDCVLELAGAIDQAIEMEGDRLRGK